MAQPTSDLKTWLREAAQGLGLPRIAFASCEPLEGEKRQAWLEQGGRELFPYLDQTGALEPSHWLENARTAVVAFLPYARPEAVPGAAPGSLKLSRYLWGRDYHQLLKARLKGLLAQAQQRIPALQGRVCVDTVPLPERDLAVRAGLGWKGKHTLLIAGKEGSWGFLGLLLLDVALPPDSSFEGDRCGVCTACIDACPTQALEPFRLDPARCLTTYNLETEREPPLAVREAMSRSRWAAGCDVCQEVCPWNRAPLWGDPLLWGGDSPLHTRPAEQLVMGVAQWQKLTRGTALRRVRHRHWIVTLRRILGASHNSLD